MTKNTFFAILFCVILSGCAAVKGIDYVVNIDQDSVKIRDPKTGATVYAESFDNKSPLTEAIINDNE